MAAHSLTLAGGSTAARTIRCPGWRFKAKHYAVSDRSSVAANEGSMLHDCMELVLDQDKTPESLIGFESHGKVLDQELLKEKLLPALAAFDSYIEAFCEDPEYEVESKVQIRSVPGAFGTADIVMFDPVTKVLTILDWKFGYMHVAADENDQLAFYANGSIEEPEFADWVEQADYVDLVIVQGGRYSAWDTDFEWLESRKLAFGAAIKEGDGDNPSFAAGDHCKFCPVLDNNDCPVHKELAAGALSKDLQKTVDTDLAYWLDKADDLEKFVKAVRAAGHTALEAGATVDGFKLVAKRNTRAWTDDVTIEAKLRQITKRKSNKMTLRDVYKRTLKSPAQMEGVLKTHSVDTGEMKEYITSRSTGTTVARESDKRPELPGLKGLENLGKF